MNALELVLTAPHSVAMRRNLMRTWRAAGDPRARLVELQLEEYEGLFLEQWRRVRDEIDELLRVHGREWAKPVSDLAKGYRYELGLVARMGLSGDAFVEHGDALVRSAPIISLNLSTPIDFAKVAASSALRNVRSLSFASLDDVGCECLVRSPHLRQLRALKVRDCLLTPAGIDQLASMDLPDLIFIDVTGNPGTAAYHRKIIRLDKKVHILGESGERLMDDANALATLDYSGRPSWPPLDTTYLFDNDDA